MLQADPAKVSARAKKRGLPQVKTKTQKQRIKPLSCDRVKSVHGHVKPFEFYCV